MFKKKNIEVRCSRLTFRFVKVSSRLFLITSEIRVLPFVMCLNQDKKYPDWDL